MPWQGRILIICTLYRIKQVIETMEYEEKKYNNESPLSIEDLFKEMKPEGKFEHLRIFLNRCDTPLSELGSYYLLVTPEGFTLCQLMDLEYYNEKIWIELREAIKDNIFQVFLDIHDINPKLFLIYWEDVKHLMTENSDLECIGDELM
jgi:hypothetical protein